MANRLSLAVAMPVFALMPSDGLAAGKAPALRDTGVPVRLGVLSDGERLIGVPDSTGMLNGLGRRWVRLRIIGYHFAFERFV